MKKIEQYEIVSQIYSGLMVDVDYKSWAEYLIEIYDDFKCSGSRFLELGGGSCLLAGELIKSGFNVTTSDLSLPMLRQNECGKINRVCCDMTKLPFRGEFDFIFSAFDSVNYLLDETALSSLFNEAGRILNTDGIFTFDVSLENNSLNNLAHLNREGEFGNFKFNQKSKYIKEKRIHLNEFEITDGYDTFREVHKQKIYPLETYFSIIDESPLYVSECFDAFTFDDGSAESARVQFVLKKRYEYAEI